MTSWLLVMAFGISDKAIVTVPNLQSPVECMRVAESIKSFTNYSNVRHKCVEVYNAKEMK